MAHHLACLVHTYVDAWAGVEKSLDAARTSAYATDGLLRYAHSVQIHGQACGIWIFLPGDLQFQYVAAA